MVSLDEGSVAEFYKSMNTYGVDLSDILLSAEKELISQDDSGIRRVPKLKFAPPPRRAKDDSELLSMAKELQNTKIKGMPEDKLIEYTQRLRTFFKTFGSKLPDDNPLVNSLNKLDNFLSEVRSQKEFDFVAFDSVLDKIRQGFRGCD